MRPWFILVFFYKYSLVSASFRKQNTAENYEEECGRGIPNPWTLMDRSCYYKDAPDGLPYADGGVFFFPSDSIFFLETSCKGGLSYREACAIESAAKAHPHRQINVLFTGPIPKDCLEDDPMISIRSYTNVKFYRIRLQKYVEGTPLESIFLSDSFNRSQYPTYHTSSLLRFLTLYKYGGIYLDLDVIVLKPFDLLPEKKNWVGLEDNEGREVGAALIAASTDDTGRLFIETALEVIKKLYSNPSSWIRESGNIIRSVLQAICSTPLLKIMSAHNCQGFSVYPADEFYQLHTKAKRARFFANGNRYKLKKSVAVHLYNSISYRNIIFENSTYANLMHDFCPQIFQDIMIVPGIQETDKASLRYPSHMRHQNIERHRKVEAIISTTTDESPSLTETSTNGYTETIELTKLTENTIYESTESTTVSSTTDYDTESIIFSALISTRGTSDYLMNIVTVEDKAYMLNLKTDETPTEATKELTAVKEIDNNIDIVEYDFTTKYMEAMTERTTLEHIIPEVEIYLESLNKLKSEKKNRVTSNAVLSQSKKRLRYNAKVKSHHKVKKITIIRTPKTVSQMPESYSMMKYAKFWNGGQNQNRDIQGGPE